MASRYCLCMRRSLGRPFFRKCHSDMHSSSRKGDPLRPAALFRRWKGWEWYLPYYNCKLEIYSWLLKKSTTWSEELFRGWKSQNKSAFRASMSIQVACITFPIAANHLRTPTNEVSIPWPVKQELDWFAIVAFLDTFENGKSTRSARLERGTLEMSKKPFSSSKNAAYALWAHVLRHVT